MNLQFRAKRETPHPHTKKLVEDIDENDTNIARTVDLNDINV